MRIKRMLPISLAVGGLLAAIGYIRYQQLTLEAFLLKDQQIRATQHQERVAAIHKSSWVVLMGNLLEQVEAELEQHPQRNLSDETIAQIAYWSQTLDPERYYYWEADSLTQKPFSPERGYLLHALIQLKPAPEAFERIKQKTSFAGADLSQADLRQVNLSGANLVRANFKGADLRDAKVVGADLRGANLWGAHLEKVDGRTAKLNRADIRWATLDEADLREAALQGANLGNAKLRKANLTGASLFYITLRGAQCQGAHMRSVDFFMSDLSQGQFSEVDFSGSRLRSADFTEADFSRSNLSDVQFERSILTGASFGDAAVQEANWFDLLRSWQATGAEAIEQRYRLEKEASEKAHYVLRENPE